MMKLKIKKDVHGQEGTDQVYERRELKKGANTGTHLKNGVSSGERKKFFLKKKKLDWHVLKETKRS